MSLTCGVSNGVMKSWKKKKISFNILKAKIKKKHTHTFGICVAHGNHIYKCRINEFFDCGVDPIWRVIKIPSEIINTYIYI